MITRKPKLRRQRKIFRQQGKLPRPDQMNINVAAWGRLLQRNFFFQKSGDISEGGSRLEKQSSSTGKIIICHRKLIITLRIAYNFSGLKVYYMTQHHKKTKLF